MDTSRFIIFISVLLVGVASSFASNHANLAAQIYWQEKLPHAKMPKSIRELLVPATKKANDANTNDHPSGSVSDVRPSMLATGASSSSSVFIYVYSSNSTRNINNDPRAALFFLHQHLRAGTNMRIRFHDPTPAASFLSRNAADSLPFSTSHYADILSKFSINPQSSSAADVKNTLTTCEAPAIAGEARLCATSLESMVDFAIEKLGNGAKAVATEAADDEKMKEYKVAPAGAMELMKGSKSVTCHLQAYPYAVYYCHETAKTRAYNVVLVRDDGARAEAVAVCHENTSGWDPKHLAFEVLKVKPGTVPICHFLPQDHLLWV